MTRRTLILSFISFVLCSQKALSTCGQIPTVSSSARLPDVSLNTPFKDELSQAHEKHPDRAIESPTESHFGSQPPIENGGDRLADSDLISILARETQHLTSREGSGASIKLVLILGALSLAPAALLMTTCYVRMIVVLMLLRQAFGGQQLPPNQVLTALALFLTLLVMTPVWNEIKTVAIDPYAQSNSLSWQEAWQRGVVPIKQFMNRQIDNAGNHTSIALFYKYTPGSKTNQLPTNMEEVPLSVLLPAFIVSELKVAFLLGFQILLPFLVLDFVVSSVTVSMGMLMLPPTMISFPLKLILFVMVDGWNLVVGMLLQSIG